MALKRDSIDREAALARLAEIHLKMKGVTAEEILEALAKDEFKATGRRKTYRAESA